MGALVRRHPRTLVVGRGSGNQVALDPLGQTTTLPLLFDEPEGLARPEHGVGRPVDPDATVLPDRDLGSGVPRDRLDHRTPSANYAGDPGRGDVHDRSAFEFAEPVAQHRHADPAGGVQVLDPDDHRIAHAQELLGLTDLDVPGRARHVQRCPAGSSDIEEPERSLCVGHGPDDDVLRLRDVAARERDHLEKRGFGSQEAQDAGVDLPSDAVGSRPGLQALAWDFLTGEN